MSNLYCNYIKERLGHESFHNENGFITYTCSSDSLLILDAYVVPEKRNNNVMQELFNSVIEKAICTDKNKVFASVAPNEALKNSNDAALRFLLKNDFRLIKSDNKNVFFVKTLKGE